MRTFSRITFNELRVIAVLGIIFAISYTQSPLYTSNQNSYLLHGLANAGLGDLSQDWMVMTKDPFPVFSFLIELTYTYLSPNFFYVYYGIIQCIFIYSILGIATKVWGIDRSNREYLTYFALVTLSCSVGFSDLRAMVQAGLAGQYILGPVFQPSTFGVFLLLSIFSFLRDKKFLAVLYLGIAANFHQSYLLSAAAITISYMVLIITGEKDFRKAFAVGLFSFFLVLPVICYSYLSFLPASQKTLEEAQDILINYRIPHHANFTAWFDMENFTKIVMMIAALYFTRGKRDVWIIMLVSFVIGLSLTFVQVATGSHSLALIFPWRISSFLVPLSAFILLGYAVSYVFSRYSLSIENKAKKIDFTVKVLLILLFTKGVVKIYSKYEKHVSKDFVEVAAFVADKKEAADVYMIPIGIKRFRLLTGVPILVDKKTHPYKDIEMVEWYKRIQLVDQFYSGDKTSRCNTLNDILQQYEVSHIVIDNENPLDYCSNLTRIYNDKSYYVYKINV